MYINNKAKIISSDIISTNGIIHIVDKLLTPQNFLITPNASGRIVVSEILRGLGCTEPTLSIQRFRNMVVRHFNVAFLLSINYYKLG